MYAYIIINIQPPSSFNTISGCHAISCLTLGRGLEFGRNATQFFAPFINRFVLILLKSVRITRRLRLFD
ncbi:hypothetical protein L2E82_30411 [Cichorium intybus]|uniref:Uncharacterized protein n=1 Tax=Cichorium intybus TaxID=13427 RepID=A0ACB9D0B0_CICIN|nr:hypothetical protein L2E82_30411 [Cichorium intybus]